MAIGGTAVLGTFVGLLAYHQLLLGPDYQAASRQTTTQTTQVPAARGAITDRNGTPLVTSETAYRLTKTGELSTETKQIVENFLTQWDIAPSDDTVLTDDAPVELLEALAESQIQGLTVTAWGKRTYHTTYAAHLLGRTGAIYAERWPDYQELGYQLSDLVGIDGIELAFEDQLHPTSGTATRQTDTDGTTVMQLTTQPQPGNTVVLTLDLDLQAAAEQALATYLPKLTDTGGGACVVLDVSDGGILACASYPTYDLSTFQQDYTQLSEDARSPMFNRALQGTYSPGSTFKLVTAVAALEEGVISPDTAILDTGRYTYYDDYQPQCWIYRQTGATHGWETVSEALRDSCNLFFYDVGRKLGIQTLNEYASAVGLGEKTGVELTEAAGVLAGPDYSQSAGKEWYDGNTLAAAIGQSDYLVTPVQLANSVATLVNGGTRWQVHLEQEIRSSDGTTVLSTYTPTALSHLSLSAETMETVKQGMALAAQEGELGRCFSTLPQSVGAKTGSAQVAGQETSNALMVCVTPLEDPQIVLVLVAEQGGSGSGLASMAADILSAYWTNLEES